MWEFTIHRSPAGSCWTWARFSEHTIQRSKRSFATWSDTFADATANGFTGMRDGYCLTELRSTAPSRLAQHLSNPAAELV